MRTQSLAFELAKKPTRERKRTHWAICKAMARKLRGDEKAMSSSSSKDLVVVVAGGCSLVTRDPTPPPLLLLLPPPLLLSRFGKTGLGAIGGGGACPTNPGGSPSDSEPESVVSSRCMVSTRLLPFPFPFALSLPFDLAAELTVGSRCQLCTRAFKPSKRAAHLDWRRE